MAIEMHELVRFATLAANGHNAQAWRFVLKPSAIEIHPDYTRRLPAVDPHDRELWISLGCALENLTIAARAVGYAPEVSYPDSADLIQVRLAAAPPRPSPLFDAIALRQNTRSDHDGKPIEAKALGHVQALELEPGVSLRFALDPPALRTVGEYVGLGDLGQYADEAFVRELIVWLRFNKREALASFDGLYSRCSGLPDLPRWIGRLFVSRAKPTKTAENDAKKLRSSAGAVVIASASESKSAWVRTGQVYERLALTMTSLGIKSAFLNQPIEVASVRTQFQRAVGLGEALPQLLVRFGYADPMPSSLRRPIDQVIAQ